MSLHITVQRRAGITGSWRMLLACVLAASVAACHRPAPEGPIAVSIVAGADVPAPTRIGLVRLDRSGQIVPALALRWAILEDGRDYLFRLDDAPGLPAAATLALRLRRLLTEPRARQLAVDSIAAVTPTVLEIRLPRAQPALLTLLALPPFEIAAAGPFVVAARLGEASLLRPRGAGVPLLLRRERAGRAIARFRAGAAALVTGGTFADLPVLRAAGIDAAVLRADPTAGLFGLAPSSDGPFAAPAMLRALDLALDRDRLAADWALPGLPSPPSGEPLTFEQLAEARALAATARAAVAGALPPLRVAMPPGPGARLLFARLAHDWRALGIVTQMVAADAPADLALIDRVVPPEGQAALACAVTAGCDPRNPAAHAPFLSFGPPIRWSLVATDLRRFTPNPLATHPLDQLRDAH